MSERAVPQLLCWYRKWARQSDQYMIKGGNSQMSNIPQKTFDYSQFRGHKSWSSGSTRLIMSIELSLALTLRANWFSTSTTARNICSLLSWLSKQGMNPRPMVRESWIWHTHNRCSHGSKMSELMLGLFWHTYNRGRINFCSNSYPNLTNVNTISSEKHLRRYDRMIWAADTALSVSKANVVESATWVNDWMRALREPTARLHRENDFLQSK